MILDHFAITDVIQEIQNDKSVKYVLINRNYRSFVNIEWFLSSFCDNSKKSFIISSMEVPFLH